MPEGPEIKRAADKLAAVIQNKPALLVEFAFPHLQQQAGMLTGQTIRKVESRGKAMLIHFANIQTIYSHNQLYGKWAILEQNEWLRPSLQVRIAIHTKQKVAVLYSASEIEVLPTTHIYKHPYIAKLGVELLAKAITQMDVLTQINQPRFARKKSCRHFAGSNISGGNWQLFAQRDFIFRQNSSRSTHCRISACTAPGFGAGRY